MDEVRLGVNAVVYSPSLILRPDVVEIGDESRIDSFVKIEGGQGVRIGRYVHVASFCHVNAGGGEVVIEDGASLSSGVVVCGGAGDPAGEWRSPVAPSDRTLPPHRARTVVGEGALVFAKAVILPGVTIGARAVIAAGAVVTHDVPPGETWAGVPARAIRRANGWPAVEDSYGERTLAQIGAHL